MSISAIIVVVIAAVASGAAAGYRLAPRGRRPARERAPAGRRILLPFTGPEISRRALEATVRLAKAEGATIVPAFLARVPRYCRSTPAADPVQLRDAADRGDRTAGDSTGNTCRFPNRYGARDRDRPLHGPPMGSCCGGLGRQCDRADRGPGVGWSARGQRHDRAVDTHGPGCRAQAARAGLRDRASSGRARRGSDCGCAASAPTAPLGSDS